MNAMSIVWIAFLTGLTTGGFSCLAVQGGLLASSVKHRGHVVVFLISKLIAYTILGYLLGALGSTLTLSPKLLGAVQIFVGLFMLATAARILNVHPIFRYFVFQPPRWTYRLLKQSSGPVTLGLLTILMPCGVTQATMAVAVASGSPLLGAAIMGAFVLGTSPIFFLLGASFIEFLNRRAFSYVAAGVVGIFAVLSINGGMGLIGSFYTIQNIFRAATLSPEQLAQQTGGAQEIMIDVTNYGYTANAQILKKDVPVRLTLVTNNTGGCARAFTIPDLNISKILPNTGREVIEFTPSKLGRLAYSCSMGMYTGAFNVIP